MTTGDVAAPEDRRKYVEMMAVIWGVNVSIPNTPAIIDSSAVPRFSCAEVLQVVSSSLTVAYIVQHKFEIGLVLDWRCKGPIYASAVPI